MQKKERKGSGTKPLLVPRPLHSALHPQREQEEGQDAKQEVRSLYRRIEFESSLLKMVLTRKNTPISEIGS